MNFLQNKKGVGARGEELAKNYLKKKGYKILDKNFKTKWGEIDLATKKNGKIVFVEVKTIQKKEGFSPEDEIDRKKKNQLRKMVQVYFSQKKIPLESACQIDILAIEILPNFKKATIKHFENAIEDVY